MEGVWPDARFLKKAGFWCDLYPAQAWLELRAYKNLFSASDGFCQSLGIMHVFLSEGAVFLASGGTYGLGTPLSSIIRGSEKPSQKDSEDST